MKLKGKAASKILLHKREKMERTLERMAKTRRNDDMFLRNVMEEKLAWAKAEKKLGSDTIAGLRNQIKSIEGQINRVQEQMLKLDGVILVIEDIKAADRKEEKRKDEERKAEVSKVEAEQQDDPPSNEDASEPEEKKVKNKARRQTKKKK
jgi:hypothetical protein